MLLTKSAEPLLYATACCSWCLELVLAGISLSADFYIVEIYPLRNIHLVYDTRGKNTGSTLVAEGPIH
jgi:hypothetical protein